MWSSNLAFVQACFLIFKATPTETSTGLGTSQGFVFRSIRILIFSIFIVFSFFIYAEAKFNEIIKKNLILTVSPLLMMEQKAEQ